MNIKPLWEWIDTGSYPLIIAGPCSAESEEQLISTAIQLSKLEQVKVFRAGIWKPRTRPNGFEGVGVKGLHWMERIKKETGLLTAVEVAEPVHIKQALDHGIDILWLGARTVVNPFSVEGLAKELQGIDLPVFVKNPISPDIKLWIGALERLNNVGIDKLVAVHRGFYFFDRSPYRNAPMWEIPIELKRLIPEIPVVCDPSHICGNKDMIPAVSQKAFDLGMNGLMIESHINPDQALTDKQQQLNPGELKAMFSQLVCRKEHGNVSFETKLEELRSEIDKIDAELLSVLSRRMDIIDEIGSYKKEHNITILQLKRWRTIFEERLQTGTNYGLYQEFIQKLLEIVHAESIRRQTSIFNKK